MESTRLPLHRRPEDRARLRVALLSVALTICFSFVCSRQNASDGRTAALLDLVNLGLLGGYALWSRDGALGTLLAAAGVFGWVELVADFLCVRCTGTLDYSPAHSTLVLASPWWMPFLWTVVGVQIGVAGDAALRRFGLVRGAVLGSLLGASLIPLYEQLAWGAHWWRYRRCLQIGHVPIYIVAAEALIGAGLSGLGYGARCERARRAPPSSSGPPLDWRRSRAASLAGDWSSSSAAGERPFWVFP